MKVIDTIWFSNLEGYIGIVLGEDEVTGKRKAYISPISGNNEAADVQRVLNSGTRFHAKTAKIILDFFAITGEAE